LSKKNFTAKEGTMAFLPRFLRFEGYETVDIKENHTDGRIEIHLKRKDDKPFECFKCRTQLTVKRGQYRLKLKEMPIMDFACFIFVWRWQGHCPKCNKAKSEHVDFISKETPHLTKDFTWWLGKLCEFSPVSRAAEFYSVGKMTTWRVDFKRMQIMLKYYKIPKVTAISVDEVYARKSGPNGESRNKKFFTIITDLNTRKVIWVAESRDKEALDQFFKIIGPKACQRIKVVAMDQHEPYRASVKEHCKHAKVVWDRFHIMQNFNEAANEVRKEILEASNKESPLIPYIQGKYRFIFLKKDKHRTVAEKQHIDEVTRMNYWFMRLEIIKERLYSFFDEQDKEKAWKIFDEIGDWIQQCGFPTLRKWWENLEKDWETLSNYFDFRVTSAVSEGINNVIKTLKRKAYGYRNMTYFRLKIMQVCGYLNSRFIPNIDALFSEL
jgi:transposase